MYDTVKAFVDAHKDKWYLVTRGNESVPRYYRVDTDRKVVKAGTDHYYWWKVEKFRAGWWKAHEILDGVATGRKGELHTLTDAIEWALKNEGVHRQ